MERIVSFIPIKLNNQRLPGKNLMPLGGKPLCSYIFETILEVDNIQEKYVYCSSEEIVSYMPEGLKFFKRDKYLDGFEVKGLEIIKYFVEDVDADIYVLTHVTQPFTKSISIQNALNKVIKEGYDSAFSCVSLKDYFWYNGKPLNYDLKDIVTTQNLNPIYMETGAFYIFRREVFKDLGQRIGEKPYLAVIDSLEATDIDTAEDFAFAEAVLEYYRRKE